MKEGFGGLEGFEELLRVVENCLGLLALSIRIS